MRIPRMSVFIGLMLLIGGAGIVSLLLLASPVAATQATPQLLDVQAGPELVAHVENADEPGAGLVVEGHYIFSLTGGCGCHFTGVDYSGGEEFSGGFGTVYARNITPHAETGIGDWTDAEIETALRHGRRPNGEQLFFIMPYMTYSGIAEDDMDELISHLRTLTPVSKTIPARSLNFPLGPFTPTVLPPATAPLSGSVSITRGGYIVDALADCKGCHNANLGGGFAPGLGFVPSIAPEPIMGIGDWTVSHIATLLRTGMKPDIPTNDRFNGQSVGGAMAGIIDCCFKHMTQTDAESIALYLQSVPLQSGLSVKKTVGANPEACSTDEQITTPQATDLYYCVTVQNTGNVPLLQHTIDDPSLGLNATFPFTLGPNSSVSITRSLFSQLGPVPATTQMTNTVTFTATYTAEEPMTVSGSAQAVVQLETPRSQVAIEVTKTVGTDANTCAAATNLTTPLNTQIYYCVTIENTGQLPLTEHKVVDPLLDINATFPFTLTPGATVNITRSLLSELGPVTATVDVTNTVTVTSTYIAMQEVAPAGAADPITMSATDTAQAVVDVESDPTALDEEPQPLERRIYLPSLMNN